MDYVDPAPVNRLRTGWVVRRARPLASAVVVLAAIGYLAAQSYPFFFHSLDHNAREIYTYGLDQYIILKLVKDALNSPRFLVNFYDYGQLYFNVSVVVGYLYSKIWALDEKTLYFILRSMSLLGGCLTVWVTFLFAARFLGIVAASFSAGALAISTVVLEWCVEPHPDTWQMFLLTLSLYLCARAMPAPTSPFPPARPGALGVRWLWASAAAAGAAFSTKYAGAMLLPLLAFATLTTPAPAPDPATYDRLRRWLAALGAVFGALFLAACAWATPARVLRAFPSWDWLLPGPDQAILVAAFRWSLGGAAALSIALAMFYARFAQPRGVRPWAVKVALLIGVAAIFTAAFVVTSPWAIWRLRFVSALYGMYVAVNFGMDTRADWFGWQWLSVIASPQLVGPSTAALACLGTLAVLAKWSAGRFRLARAPLVLVAGWAVIFVGFLLLRVNIVHDEYLLPVAPAIVILAAAPLAALRTWVAPRLGLRASGVVAAGVATLALGLQASAGVEVFRTFKATRLRTALPAEKAMMGDWMLRCIPHESRVIAAPYSYVPPQFDTALLFTDPGYYSYFHDFAPDLVILDKALTEFYTGKIGNVATDRFGTTGDMKRYYETVARSGEWRQGPAFGEFQIYLTPALAARVAAEPGCS